MHPVKSPQGPVATYISIVCIIITHEFIITSPTITLNFDNWTPSSWPPAHCRRNLPPRLVSYKRRGAVPCPSTNTALP